MNLAELLRRAVENEPVPRDLEAKVRSRLELTSRSGPAIWNTAGGVRRSAYGRGTAWGRLVSSLGMLAVVIAGMAFVSIRKSGELLALGVNDHVHCAIAGNYPRQTMRVEMTDGLGEQFGPMLQPVIDAAGGVGSAISVVSAHRCSVSGRAYVHIILRRGQTMLSVILTRRGEGEEFPGELVARAFHGSGVPLHEGNRDGYSVSGFESGGWLGYVVSDMPASRNRDLANRIAPVVGHYTIG
jgi:hypothetical protein